MCKNKNYKKNLWNKNRYLKTVGKNLKRDLQSYINVYLVEKLLKSRCLYKSLYHFLYKKHFLTKLNSFLKY